MNVYLVKIFAPLVFLAFVAGCGDDYTTSGYVVLGVMNEDETP
jgi:hypothetical protein